MKSIVLASLLFASACTKSSPPQPHETRAKPAVVKAEARRAEALKAATDDSNAEDVEDPADYHAGHAANYEPEVKELASAAAFLKTADGKAAKKRWAESATWKAPDGTTHTLRAVEHEAGEDSSVELVDERGGRIAEHEIGGPASAISGRVAVLPNGHVLFEAGQLNYNRSRSTVYTLAWDKDAKALELTMAVAYTEEM